MIYHIKEIPSAAHDGDPLAKTALAHAGEFIGLAITDFLHIFNPSIVIIRGGVSQSGQLLLDPLRLSLQKHAMTHHCLTNGQLTTASLGDEDDLLGTLALARDLPAENNFPH